MALRKSDTQEATELLQNLSNKLDPTSNKSLKQAMEKLCQIFQSDLFNSLLDVQEYYAATLEVGEKSRQAFNDEIIPAPIDETDPKSKKDKSKKKKKHKTSKHDLSEPPVEPEPYHVQHDDPVAMGGNQPQEQTLDTDWEYYEIDLHKTDAGFGFSIAGGIDAPHFEDDPNDPSIVVSKLVPNGVAEMDGRLQYGDIITSVNGFSVEYVHHEDAVNALKQSGKDLLLIVRRYRDSRLPPPPEEIMGMGQAPSGGIIQVDLYKRPTGGGLGFTISGLDDGGVEVTTVLPGGVAESDGNIHPGDKIIQVNEVNIEFSSHDEAVNVLKSTGEHVQLLLLKPSMMDDQEYQYEDPLPPPIPEANYPPEIPIEKSAKKSKSHGGLFKKSKK